MSGKKYSLTLIFLTILIDCIGFGIIIPVTPKLIEQLSGKGAAEASTIGGWLMFAYSIMQFIFAPILGGISDKYGRKPVLLIALFGLGLDYLMLSFAPSLAWLFVGRLIAGFCGASFSVASAYIADVSEPENRAKNFGLIGAAFGVGFILGPLLGALFSAISVRAPFMAASALSLINFFLGLFLIQESLKKENRRPFEFKRANPLGAFLNLKRYPHLIALLVGQFFLYMAGKTIEIIWGYYNILKFGWSEKQIGISLTVVGILVSLVQGLLIRWFIKRYGNFKSIVIGMFFYIIGLFCFSFASADWMMYVFLIPYCLGGLSGPAIQGLASSKIPENEQGEFQGLNTAMLSLVSIINPIVMSSLFYSFSKPNATIYFPGISFFISGFLAIIGGIFIYTGIKKNKLIV